MDLRLAVMLVTAMYFSTAAGKLIITQKKYATLIQSVCKTDASSSEHTYTYAKLVVCLEVWNINLSCSYTYI